MARYKAYEMRDRAAENPWILPLLGGGIGALIGKALTSRAQDRRYRHGWAEWSPRDYRSGDGYGLRERERYEVWAGEDPGVPPIDETYQGTGLDVESEGEGGSRGMRERAGEIAGDVKGRALDMKDRATGKMTEVRDRLAGRTSGMRDRMRSGAYELRDRMPGREDLRASAYESPALWACGAMAAGALFGLVLPVTRREREMMEPARERLREAGQEAAHKVKDRMSEKLGAHAGGGEHDEQRQDQPQQTGPSDLGIGSPSSTTPGGAPGTEPLH